MTTPQDAGQQTCLDFIDAFNRLDHAGIARTLNYPHVRLANGQIRSVETAADYTAISTGGEPGLLKEGWHHTNVTSIETVHQGDDKFHVALSIERCKANGEVYNRFDTLWIVTLEDGHWGIRFRSSFLR